MEFSFDLVFFLTLAAMLVGLVGSVVPGVPGVPLIFLAALVYAYLTGFEIVGAGILILLGAFAVLALAADYIGTAYGARKYGASWAGTLGGAVGGIVGTLVGALFLGIGAFFGLILGTVGGVFLGEYLKRQRTPVSSSGTEGPRVERASDRPSGGSGDWQRSSRAAGGVLVGYLISAVAQGILALASLAAFVLALIY
ncbi:MAG: DUF456 domain-containing protein [Rubrobacter sp.]|nr:DUF456 domain-containing protein [Rubrobacter sp.]